MTTASKDAQPHVVPIIYAMDGQDIIIAVDYGTKKLKNLRENPEAALVVDEYGPNSCTDTGAVTVTVTSTASLTVSDTVHSDSSDDELPPQ